MKLVTHHTLRSDRPTFLKIPKKSHLIVLNMQINWLIHSGVHRRSPPPPLLTRPIYRIWGVLFDRYWNFDRTQNDDRNCRLPIVSCSLSPKWARASTSYPKTSHTWFTLQIAISRRIGGPRTHIHTYKKVQVAFNKVRCKIEEPTI